MTFFYDLNKKLAGLVQLNEGKAKPDFLDVDKDGNKKESFKQAVKDKEQEVAEGSTGDYSAKKARAGKDIGKPGKAFSKIAADAAKRYGSKERGEKVAGAVLAKLRKEDIEEDFGPLEEKGAKKAKPDYIDLDKDGNKKESMKKAAADKKKNAFDPEVARSMFAPEKGKTKTGHDVKDTGYSKRYTKSLADEPESDDEASDTPKKKGRKAVGAGKGKKIGAKHAGTSKLHRKAAIAEEGDDISLLDKGEYDQEGDMAKDDLQSIAMAAKELHAILGDDQNLPEWVQSKITKALDYINASNQYMHQQERDVEVVPERKLSSSEKEEREDIVKGMKKNKAEFKKRYGKRGEEVMYATATKMAKERGPGNPDRKKEESVKETDAPKKAKGGIKFGQGVYESFNSRVENMITESMNVNVSMSTGQNGEPTKSITVSAEGNDAEMLAQLLNLAGLQGKEAGCDCGQTPCGCEQVDEVDENNPDWPTDAETTGEDDPELRRWAGGLNGPKSTGQTTNAPFNRQRARQGAGPMAENTDLGMNLYKEFKNFKAK